ncbi:MAG TPA: metal ABC transporter ATP-binding protein [Spirochaetales bacterium]|nr:metal ABC transporter ATP-binding protein [Spirochaetales bacterium]HRY54405.1 metal ABC transporter ATP-binding protein [Spirochaetia bacterium]HRZ64451.1 metal ABC transporter ATP-binding protein [Spirochaetia bacterium]
MAETTARAEPRSSGTPRPATRPVAVRFDEVHFSYGSIGVLEGASFHIHAGEFAALLGPNGSGKTTMLKLLLGLLRPDAGRVLVFGEEARAASRQVGYVPQAVVYDPAFPISVAEVVLMGRLRGSFGRYGRADQEAAARAMNEADVAGLASRPYAALSGGQRRRVLVARALAAEPRLLVLDEPTSNMDAESEAQLFQSLGRLKGRATILIVTHDTGFVSALTDSVLCLGDREGRRGAVVHHPAAPVEGEPPKAFGGAALRVLHEAELPEDGCFSCEGEER